MKLRNQKKAQQRAPQRTLFEDGRAVLAMTDWCPDKAIDYLGASIRLRCNTNRRQAALEGDVLHLPLPPQATPRQIQDAAESWLRQEAIRLFKAVATHAAVRQGRDVPELRLSFSARSDWTVVSPDGLSCNWRLIEQPVAVIETALARAVAELPPRQQAADLFGVLSL